MSRIVFMGTPDFAVPTLLELAGQGHEIAAVYSRAPTPAGRGMAERKSPVHDAAERLGVPVYCPRSLKGEAERQFLASLAPDLIIVVAYGLILPQGVLDIPEYCLNLHASLLPRWRGAAPINRAIMEGDARSGVMVMKMEAGLDTGPIAMAEEIAITPEMTAGELHDRLATLGADLMVRAVAAAARGGLRLRPQPEAGVTYARKIDKSEARIDWSQPARVVHGQINGLSPFPGAFCEVVLRGKRERVKILKAIPHAGEGAPGAVLAGEGFIVACGQGALRLISVQRAGKGPVDADSFLRGTDLVPGSSLS